MMKIRQAMARLLPRFLYVRSRRIWHLYSRFRLLRASRSPSEAWKLSWALRDGGPLDRVENADDCTFESVGAPHLRYRPDSSDVSTFAHVYLADGYRFPFRTSTPRVIVDAGANAGYATVWFAERFPEAQIIAVEPDGENFELLESNTSALPNVTCLRAALSDTDDPVFLTDPGEGPWAYRTTSLSDRPTSARKVDAVTVANLIERFSLEEIDLLKVDIEGAESVVFADPSGWIDRVNSIAIELHDRFLPGCTDIFDAATAAFTRRAQRGEDTFVAR